MKAPLPIRSILCSAALAAALCAVPAPTAARAAARPAVLERGVVAAPESIAAEVGAHVLRDGGNAVDAAVAVQFALAVTYPRAGNLGGGGFMLVHTAGGDETLDYRETAPAAARRDMFLDSTGAVIPGASLETHLAAGVPGSVAGMWLAHQRHGSLPWRRLVEPAVALAERGFVLDERTAAEFAEQARAGFHDYFRGAPGTLFRQPELAATLRRIADQGRDGFYRGETARLIAREMERGGGLVTLADLEAYQAKVRPPLVGEYRGCRVVSMAPPSSGGLALVQLLRMLERWRPDSLGHDSAAYLHLVAELEARVFADRAEYLGDPDFVRVPVDTLVSVAYVAARAADVALDRHTPPAAVRPGLGGYESEQTTHFSIVDRGGNVVANTTTLNDLYGSGIVVRGAGFLLNDEMDDFSARPGARNLYGVTGGAANAVAPGRRMLSSMAPTLVYRDGLPWLVLGSPGGPTIFTTVFQVIVNRLDFGLPLEQAVTAPRFHHQWPPPPGAVADSIAFERGHEPAPAARAALEALGYGIRPRSPLGEVQAIEISGPRARGFSDPRGRGRVAIE